MAAEAPQPGPTESPHRVPDFAIFSGFSIFGFFGILGPKMGPKGPGRASNGSGEAFCFIWTKFQPKWAHLAPIRAPFCFSISPKPILGPNSSKSIIPWRLLSCMLTSCPLRTDWPLHPRILDEGANRANGASRANKANRAKQQASPKPREAVMPFVLGCGSAIDGAR